MGFTLNACAQTPSAPAAPAVAEGVAAVPANPAPPQATIDTGKKLYTSYCARCHGLNMMNTGAAFDLRTFPKNARPRFEASIKQGIRAMPAWGNTFSADELAALWAYVAATP